MGGIGFQEIALIGVLVVVLFGAKKLPQLGEGLGKGISNFKKALSSSHDTKSEEVSSASEKGTT